MQDTRPLLLESDFPAITRRGIGTLQVNLGYRCNQSCAHCHVNAGPTRTEQMDADTLALVLEVLDAERGLFSGQLNEAQARGDVVTALVSLYRALGGGWVSRAEQMADAPSRGAPPQSDLLRGNKP